MTSVHRLRTALLGGALAAVVGCGESKFEYAPVQGLVTLDGAPLADAKVVFMPISSRDDADAGPYSRGSTNGDGRFTLETATQSPRPGAVAGAHKVIIKTRRTSRDPNNPDRVITEAEERLPRRYTNSRETVLEFKVPPGGSTDANFALTSP